MRRINLDSVIVTDSSPAYIIAEVGVNHGGSLERAYELIELAHAGGADAVKFQTYKAENIAQRDSPSYWDLTLEPTRNQFDLFKKFDGFNASDYMACAKYARELGITFISTPFDLSSVDMLDDFVPYYKISSSDITNIPLIRRIASARKPVILSTGASNLDEIETAIENLETHGATSIALLHCVLCYPTDSHDANLNMISGLRDRFPQFVIGYSDHTLPDRELTVLCTSYILGARIIEKHFTYDKTLSGNDHRHSINVTELRFLKQRLEFLSMCLGHKEKMSLNVEAQARKNARRSIVFSRDLPAGHTLGPSDLKCLRPGNGIGPEYWDLVIGRTLRQSRSSGQLLSLTDLIESSVADDYIAKNG